MTLFYGHNLYGMSILGHAVIDAVSNRVDKFR